MREFIVNKYLSLKLEEEKTILYVDSKPFEQCKYLLLQIPQEHVNDLNSVDSIDEASEKLSHILEPHEGFERMAKINPEIEFWAHCSNLQAWYENEYDTRLLHSNLAFPLLKKLTEVGDPLARKVFKEEIALRLESGYPSVVIFLIIEKYIDYLEREDFLLSILNEKDAFTIIEIEKILNIKLRAEYENFDFCDDKSFLFYDNKVQGLALCDLEVNSVFEYIVELEHIYYLGLVRCNLTKIPSCIEKLKNLIYLELSENKLETVPREIKKLSKLQEIFLNTNSISDIENIAEIIESLEHLNHLYLHNNKIEILPDKLAQLETKFNFKINI